MQGLGQYWPAPPMNPRAERFREDNRVFRLASAARDCKGRSTLRGKSRSALRSAVRVAGNRDGRPRAARREVLRQRE
jgi:hypothetical protein